MEYDHPWPEAGLRHNGHYGHYGHYGHGDPGLMAEAPGAKSNTPKAPGGCGAYRRRRSSPRCEGGGAEAPGRAESIP